MFIAGKYQKKYISKIHQTDLESWRKSCRSEKEHMDQPIFHNSNQRALTNDNHFRKSGETCKDNVGTFEAYKAAGPDEIILAVL